MKNNINYTALLAVLIISCTSSESIDNKVVSATYNEISKAYFFIGKWENREKDGVTTEQWQKLNDSVFVGESYFVSGNDTLSSEKITLQQRGNQLYFIPTVKGQNNNQPIEFKLSESSPTHLVFENVQHDFPKKITYSFITSDSLLANVSGIINNTPTTHWFPLKRVK